jgi:lipoprotein-anchoring transpeptidase ErfK/SrfK
MVKSILLLCIAIPFSLSSCAGVKGKKTNAAKAVSKKDKKEEVIKEPEPILFEWNGEEATGPATVKISLAEQKARIYKKGQEVGWTYVATGVEGHRTPTGSFRILEKKEDKYSNLWGVVVDANGDTVVSDARNGTSRVPGGGRFVGASMPNWMRLTSSGIGMHGGPIPNPGSPASHGCIRLPYEMAQHMFAALPSGTPVTITN